MEESDCTTTPEPGDDMPTASLLKGVGVCMVPDIYLVTDEVDSVSSRSSPERNSSFAAGDMIRRGRLLSAESISKMINVAELRRRNSTCSSSSGAVAHLLSPRLCAQRCTPPSSGRHSSEQGVQVDFRDEQSSRLGKAPHIL